MPKDFRLAFIAGLAFVLSQGFAPAQAEGPASRILRDGFDGADFAEAGGLYYRENDEQAAGTAEFQSGVKRNGAGSLKLTVRSLCPIEDSGCSERAEIWERTPLRVPYDTAVWYGFAVKFADPIPADDHRYLIAQWKREIGPDAQGDFSPYLGFRFSGGKLFVTVETNYHEGLSSSPQNGACPDGAVPAWLRPETNQIRALVVRPDGWSAVDAERFTSCTDKIVVTNRGNALPDVASGWIYFGVLSKPGPDGTGHIEIFANGKWIVSVKGAIGHSDAGLGENQYFKFGPYRDGAPGLWSLYYDDFVRSPNCEDVLEQKEQCRMIDP
ncbi:polysaccharide lyase [Rhizobium puerariae]|uniref:Polysaccharide lyase n=1 Tax=Rhizobium puerariae TaxID=1585791 RepID=A0ABV6AF87_9HYPH